MAAARRMSLRIGSLDGATRGGNTPRVLHESARLVTTSATIADRTTHSPSRRRAATPVGWLSAAAGHAQAPALAEEAPAATATPALPARVLQVERPRRP